MHYLLAIPLLLWLIVWDQTTMNGQATRKAMHILVLVARELNLL